MSIQWQARWMVVALALISTSACAVNFGKMKPSEVGFYVADLKTGQEIASYRADEAMNPASTMKLLTSYAALRELGEHYTWKTEFKSDAKVVDGVLQGNLYWVGSGDPVFDQKNLIEMINDLNRQGIRGIKGNLVLDRSVWSHIGTAENFDSDAEAAFTTPPDPQMLAFKVAWLGVDIGVNGKPVLKLEPALPNVVLNTNINNRNKGGCRDIRQYLNIKVLGKSINVNGSIPPSCLGKKAFVNVLEAREFAEQSFLAHWEKAGNTPPANIVEGKVPKGAKVLVSHLSPSLSEVLMGVNKHSNNTIARTIFLTLGQQEGNSPNTIASAERAMRRSFAQARLFDDEALVIENGSGLSRRERVTPRYMGQLLKSVYDSPQRPAFVNSLPVAGVDGTLRNRFKNLGSNLKMKTGTLRNVRALSGYWLPEQNGRNLIIVVMINSPNSGGYLADMDKLVTELVRTYGQNE